jgi:hypothetical protein
MGGFSVIDATGRTETTVDFESYPKLAILPMECLRKNESDKPVSVEQFQIFYQWHYSQTWVAILDFLPVVKVYELNSICQQAKLPVLIAPAEEIGVVIRLGWPLETKALEQFDKECPGEVETGRRVYQVVDCLRQHNLTLTDNPSWHGTRTLSIFAIEAGGRQIHVSQGQNVLDEDYVFR